MRKCEVCGTLNEDDAEYCKHCGKKLYDGTDETGLVRCRYCGLLQSSKNHYCVSCGTTLFPEEYTCPFCGFPLDTSWEYCPMCGVPLKSKGEEDPHLIFNGGYKLWLPPEISKDGVIIGREKIPETVGADVIPFVSKKHFQIYFDGGQYMIIDVGSTNGTILDGQLLEPGIPAILKNGSTILIAKRIRAVFKRGDVDDK